MATAYVIVASNTFFPEWCVLSDDLGRIVWTNNRDHAKRFPTPLAATSWLRTRNHSGLGTKVKIA